MNAERREEAAPVDQSIDEASKVGDIEAAQSSVWKDGRSPERVCSARRSNGEPCKRAAINGGNVCATHGGRSPQVKAKARVRLEMASDRLARKLLGIAEDDERRDQLAAINSALDRAGLSAKTAIEVEVGPSKPFEQLIAGMMTGGSRAESRAARGLRDDTPRLDSEEFVDAEIVDEYVTPTTPYYAVPGTPTTLLQGQSDRPERHASGAAAPAGATGRAGLHQRQKWPPIVTLAEAHPDSDTSPNTGLVSMEEALDQLAASRPPRLRTYARRSRSSE